MSAPDSGPTLIMKARLQSIQSLVTLRILVTGGAGYIGAHTVRLLLEQGHDVTIADDLSKGYRHNVPVERLYELDIRDTGSLTELMRRRRIDAVIHFAAYIAVGESMRVPERYFANNVGGSLSLLTAMVEAGVKRIVFSSTAAVYGNPHTTPILEDFPIQPVSPYGAGSTRSTRFGAWRCGISTPAARIPRETWARSTSRRRT